MITDLKTIWKLASAPNTCVITVRPVDVDEPYHAEVVVPGRWFSEEPARTVIDPRAVEHLSGDGDLLITLYTYSCRTIVEVLTTKENRAAFRREIVTPWKNQKRAIDDLVSHTIFIDIWANRIARPPR